MKHFSFLQLAIVALLAMTMLHTTNASAKMYMGKITLEVGEEYIVSAVPTSGFTASGSFSKDGTCFVITANGSYYCTIKANKAGKGTLSYWGSVVPSNSWSTYIYDYYWDIEVKSNTDPGPDPFPILGIEVNEENFPDKIFRENIFNRFGSVLDQSEIENMKYYWLEKKEVKSLKGIEYFTALTMLQVDNLQLTSLDVSKLTALEDLFCDHNNLTSLDVSKNTSLKRLDCQNNQLTSLDVSKNKNLENLYCYNNKIVSLIVSENAPLRTLWCWNNRITGTEMDNLIKSLPMTTNGWFNLLDTSSNTEKNKIVNSQITAAKAKGWIPKYNNGESWVDYEGSEDTSTATSISLPVSQTVNVGSTLQLTPTIEPATAEATLTWTTDDATIAKVTSTGVVFGSKEGTAIITVTTDNGLKAECFVMVQLPSGISSVGADSEDTPVYTLSGQRLAAPRKGLNIRGGKMIVVK